MTRKMLLRVALLCLGTFIAAITASGAVAAVEGPSSDPLSGLGPSGTYCYGTPVVFDDQWSNGYRLVCHNNMYVLMVDLTNPAIKAEVVATTAGLQTVSSYADSNTIAIINADYQYSPCPSGAICSNGLTISNGSSPTAYTNLDRLCNDGFVRRQIGFSQDQRPVVDWWYKFVSDSQARAWCDSRNTDHLPLPGQGGGLEEYSYNLVGGGPQFTFDGIFQWKCGLNQIATTGDCPASGTDVIINGEYFGVGTRWNTYQSAVGYTSDGETLVLGESNYQTHTMQETHNIMSQRVASYGQTLDNAFRLDGGNYAGFWYYKSAYSSTPWVTAPNVIRIQRTNSTCYSLSTSVSPSGAGNVNVLTPSNCAQGKYLPGTVVQLSAGATSPYTFSNWSGDASGSSSTTSVTMNANKTVTANFSQPCYSLATAVNPTGSGSISANPGPNCGSNYASGTVVQLTASPGSGYRFMDWSGDATGTANPTSITMNSAKTVTANFTASGTRLYLSPSENSISAGQVFAVTIRCELLDYNGSATGDTADTVDAYLNFDPTYLEVVDTVGNPVAMIDLNTAVFSSATVNSVNNITGQIDFSASKYDSPYLTGSFTAATIRFKAKAGVTDTDVTFARSQPRWSDVLRAGNSLGPALYGSTVTAGPAMILNGQVALEQRGPAGDPRWVTQLYRVNGANPGFTIGGIEVYRAGTATKLGSFAADTDNLGVFSVSLPGIDPGAYDVRVKGADTLSNQKGPVTLPAGEPINFGTLLVGDSNGDDAVDVGDVSYMVPSFLLCKGDADYRVYADTNKDDCVNGADVSALIPNFLRAGPMPVTSAISHLVAGTTESPLGTAAGASLSLVPASSSMQVGDVLALEIMADTGTGDADSIQTYIDFDPALLEVVDAAGNPASAIELNTAVFGSATYNSVDNAAGRIDFSAVRYQSPFLTGVFRAATVRFKAKALTSGAAVQFVRVQSNGLRRWSDLWRSGTKLDAVLSHSTVRVGRSVYLPLLWWSD